MHADSHVSLRGRDMRFNPNIDILIYIYIYYSVDKHGPMRDAQNIGCCWGNIRQLTCATSDLLESLLGLLIAASAFARQAYGLAIVHINGTQTK